MFQNYFAVHYLKYLSSYSQLQHYSYFHNSENFHWNYFHELFLLVSILHVDLKTRPINNNYETPKN